jgi:hypothetical protein
MSAEDDRLLTVQDVYNVIAEHMSALDHLWPDHDIHGPRKIHLVELIDGIKLKLIARAEKNATKYEGAFEKAARKITGSKWEPPKSKEEKPIEANVGKSQMQLAHEAAQARIRK